MRGALTAAFLLLPAAAHAAMSYVPDAGTVARARGTAFTAAANDPMAIVYNPAGFADQQQMQVYVDVSVISLSLKHDREGCADWTDPNPPNASQPAPCGAVSNSGAPKVSPTLIFSMPVWRNLVWHAGVYGGTGVNHKYPADGPQRFVNVEQVPTQASYTTGVSMRPVNWFAFGLTFGGIYASNEQKVVSTSPYGGEPRPNEHPTLDRPLELTVSDPFSPTATLGVKFYLDKAGVEIGASYRIPTETSMGGDYTSATAGAEKVHLKVDLPSIARLGVRKKMERFDVELDFVMEDWTGRKADVISVDDGDYFGEDAIVRVRDGGVAYRVALGSSFRVNDALALHGGVLHETSAIPEERMMLTLYDTPKTGVNLGASYAFGKMMVAGSLSYIDGAKVNITNSRVDQGGVLIDDQYKSITGNGSYDGAYTLFGLSFGMRFQ